MREQIVEINRARIVFPFFFEQVVFGFLVFVFAEVDDVEVLLFCGSQHVGVESLERRFVGVGTDKQHIGVSVVFVRIQSGAATLAVRFFAFLASVFRNAGINVGVQIRKRNAFMRIVKIARRVRIRQSSDPFHQRRRGGERENHRENDDDDQNRLNPPGGLDPIPYSLEKSSDRFKKFIHGLPPDTVFLYPSIYAL